MSGHLQCAPNTTMNIFPSKSAWTNYIMWRLFSCCLLTSLAISDCNLYVLVIVLPPNVPRGQALHLDHASVTLMKCFKNSFSQFDWDDYCSYNLIGMSSPHDGLSFQSQDEHGEWAPGDLLLLAISSAWALEHRKVMGFSVTDRASTHSCVGTFLVHQIEHHN